MESFVLLDCAAMRRFFKLYLYICRRRRSFDECLFLLFFLALYEDEITVQCIRDLWLELSSLKNNGTLGIWATKNNAFIASVHSIFIVSPCCLARTLCQWIQTERIISFHSSTLFCRAWGRRGGGAFFCSHLCFHIENFHFICLKAPLLLIFWQMNKLRSVPGFYLSSFEGK